MNVRKGMGSGTSNSSMKSKFMILFSSCRFSILLMFVGGALPVYSVASSGESSLDAFYNLPLSQLGKVEITTATGNSTPLDRAPATASVITADEIKAMGARTLDEVLETVPGFHVSVSALSRLDSVYSVRGIHTGFNPHVLLLMNGVPVQFSVQGGRPILFRYPVGGIARIEVIRGPGSAIYGADAYSGVINVITKDASTIDGASFGIRVGSFDSLDFWAEAKSNWQDWDFTYSFSYQKSDGDRTRTVDTDAQTGLDLFVGTNASLAPGPLSTRYEVYNTHIAANQKHWTLNLWSWISNDSGVGAGAAQILDYKGGDDSDLFLVDTSYNTADKYENWDHRLRLSYQYYDTQAQLNIYPSGSSLPLEFNEEGAPVRFLELPDGLIGNPGGTTRDGNVDFISSFTGIENHRVRFALGLRHQELDSRESKNFGPGVMDGTESMVDGTLTDVSDTPFVFVKDTSRITKYMSFQDEWHFAPDWDLTTGVRFDRYSDFGSTTNPRVALVWAAHEKITAKLLYGSAFRAPSFSEQFNANNPIALGNSELDPEEIDTYEFSMSIDATQNLRSSLSLFMYRAKGMIEFIPDDGATSSTAQNARDQKGRGFEWEVNWDLNSRLRIKGNYSLNDSINNASNSKIAEAPGRQASINANWELPRNWSINSQINWVGRRIRFEGDTRPNIDDYTLVDIMVRYSKPESPFSVGFALRNVGDYDAREPSSADTASKGAILNDYPLAGRSFWTEINYEL